MADIVKEVQQTADKVYENGKTFLQNIQEGIFIPPKHLKNHAEMKDLVNARFDSLESLIKDKMSKISK